MNIPIQNPETVKSCCASLYETDWARLLLGETFHPGGLELTERLGTLLELDSTSRVLDVASGKGTSAIYIAQHFGCEVVGLDYGEKTVVDASAAAESAGMVGKVTFKWGDAEGMPFENGEFDAVICECAFCTFPAKQNAAREFARILRPGGRVGISDLTRIGPLPTELETLLAWIACIADAQPVNEYVRYLQQAGFSNLSVELHDQVLSELISGIRTKLLGAELMVKLKKLDLPGIDFEQAKQLAHSANDAVKKGILGYAIIIGMNEAKG